MSPNAYSNKSSSTFKNFVIMSSSKIYEDDNIYKNNLKKLGVDIDDDIFLYKNIKVDFIYDTFYKKMNGEGFIINVLSDKNKDLTNEDIEDLVFVLEGLLSVKFEDKNKNILLLASQKNTPKFKIIISKFDLWFDFYPKNSLSNGYFKRFVAISKNKPA